MSRRIAMLVGETSGGSFVCPLTGAKLPNVADDGIDSLVKRFIELRGGDGIIKTKKDEVQLKSLHLIASGTAGGCLKAPHRFRV